MGGGQKGKGTNSACEEDVPQSKIRTFFQPVFAGRDTTPARSPLLQTPLVMRLGGLAPSPFTTTSTELLLTFTSSTHPRALTDADIQLALGTNCMATDNSDNITYIPDDDDEEITAGAPCPDRVRRDLTREETANAATEQGAAKAATKRAAATSVRKKCPKKCPHWRQRTKCKPCGGGAICEHNRVRSTCKQCGGGSICEHNRQRNTCKQCGGVSICEHDQQRNKCWQCGGSSMCEHNRQRNKCKQCGGNSI
eukprot:928249-Rhodomonas_salina.1